MRRPGKQKIAWIAVTALVCAYYFWIFGTAFDRFVWSDHLDDYYNLLARGFVNGHLYIPVEPRPELLALPDPWASPANRPYRLLDAVLYHKRYYLYHGAAPALFVFAPWRLLTGHDLPQCVAGYFFCVGGYLFLSVLLMNMLGSRASPVPLWMFVLFCISLGFAQGVPFVLQHTLVYEVAITSGYFCLSAGFFFLFKTLTAPENGTRWAVLCGSFLGVAVGCRPHLGVAIIPAFAAILVHCFRRDRSRPLRRVRSLARGELPGFVMPVVICGIAIAGYNYLRFGDPLEFGLRYLLGEPVYQNVHLAVINIIPGLYYLLGCAPDLDPVFPFFRLAVRPPFNSPQWALPGRYFLEPTTGALYLFPPALLALAAPFLLRRYRAEPIFVSMIAVLFTYSCSCIVFIAATGLNSQRFEVDFLPFLVLVSCLLLPGLLERFQTSRRLYCQAIFSAAVLYAVAINFLYAVQGPFDLWLQNRPEGYIRFAQWFSPRTQYRPLLNPSVRVKAYFDLTDYCRNYPLPLIGVGRTGSRYMLTATCPDLHSIWFRSEEGVNVRTALAKLRPGRQNLVEIEFEPRDRIMNVRLDNETVMQHQLAFLMTAPFHVRCGIDDLWAIKHRYAGPLLISTRQVGGLSGENSAQHRITDLNPPGEQSQ